MTHKKTKRGSFLKSSHKWTYIWIAIKNGTTPSHVYDLAHGKEIHEKDHSIMHDLVKYKIIHHR